jgi:hypothetical protein
MVAADMLAPSGRLLYPMKTLAWLSLVSLASLGGLVGCMGGSSYRVTPIRSGALYASRGAACAIQFQNLTFQEGSAKYENLGLVSLTGISDDELTPKMKSDVERAACKMGGDAVSLNASAPGIFQFIVWRSR